ncbi:MAG: hypothetical protein AB2598_20435 [Candidatus Thiodiazotropha sp.]
MHQLLSVLELSLILSFVSLAAVFTFRFAGFPDLSVDGVFGLGAVLFAKLYFEGFGYVPSFFFAAFGGLCAGFITASISSRFKVNPILASVIMLTMLYSINYRILGTSSQAIYEILESFLGNDGYRIATYLGLVTLLFLSALFFFRTEFGTAIRATGSSPEFLTSVGRNVTVYRILLVAIAGGLVATSGALLAIRFGFAEVSMGVGTIIIGIASLIIGEKLVGRRSYITQVLAAFVGIFVYELAVGVALSVGMSPIDVKLLTGVLTIILLAITYNERDRLFA